jgi:aerobic C4-dicarboxylate transport protein
LNPLLVESPAVARPLYRNLTVQVLAAVAVGVGIGVAWPETGQALKPLADGFIKLVRMVVGPVVFLSVVVGIARAGDLKRVGRVGVKALVYFEVVTTVALAIGLVVSNLLRPGEGVARPGADAIAEIAPYVQRAQHQSATEFVLGIIPSSVVGAFTAEDALPVVFLAVLVGVALAMMGAAGRGERVVGACEALLEVVFKVVAMIVRVAPLGALGAMAFVVGKYGTAALLPLVKLMACVYLTMALFITLVLGPVLRVCGVSLWRYLVYIKDEIVLVLGTSSSESALPRLIQKMERAGCGREVVGLVVPAGYSFNLDGTSIYLSMAVLFIAQAYGVSMGMGQQVGVLALLMLTSKGAAGVTGAGFVTLAATLSATHVLPVEGLALLLGVDRFMSEARSITNLIGNGVAAIAVSAMERELDRERWARAVGRDGGVRSERGVATGIQR